MKYTKGLINTSNYSRIFENSTSERGSAIDRPVQLELATPIIILARRVAERLVESRFSTETGRASIFALNILGHMSAHPPQ